MFLDYGVDLHLPLCAIRVLGALSDSSYAKEQLVCVVCGALPGR